MRLEPLDEQSLISLLEVRTPGRVSALRHRLGLFPAEFYARRVLRKVAEMDEESGHIEAPAPDPVAAAAIPAAVPALDAAAAPAAVSEPPVAVAAPAPSPVEPVVERPAEHAPVEVPATSEPSARPVVSPFAEAAPASASALRHEVEAEVVSEPEVAEEQEPVAAAGGDRIDDLLRQFRERYGRE